VAGGTFDRPDALSGAECAALIALAEAKGLEPAPVYGRDGAALVNARMRSAAHVLIARGGAADWLFARLDALFAQGAAAFDTQADPLFEPVQIVLYRPGDHFHWHSDAGADRIEARLLSASVELSDPADYRGGLLEIAPARMAPERAPPRGHATLFPSRALHRVTPVTDGMRYALVAWTGLNAA
jgi:PKHD-type hydroxylase